MSEEIDALWALRELDEKMLACRAETARFPDERGTMAHRVSNERAHVEESKSRLAAAQMGRRQLEKDIDVLAEQERKFQSQLPAVKKNEEYTALLHEISATRQKRSDLETRVLLQLEEEEQVQAERPIREAALHAAEREAAERGAKLDTAESEIHAKLAALEAERAQRLTLLTPMTRSRYERVRASREGRAVVAILKGACGGCYRTQPPQMLQEAKRRDRFVICDGCGLLLIWPPEGA